MTRTTLDELDGKILHSLSRNCRVSYNSLGSEIGLSAKSVKARVKKMQSSGVIDSFIVKVNPLVLGYSKFCILVLRINSKAADEKHIRRSLSLLGDILYTGHVLGNISTFKLAVKKEAEEKLELLVDVIGQDLLIQNQTVVFQNVREQPTYTDFKIMRCLLDNSRMEISDIAEKISMSSKTVTRRLEKMIENHVLDFTVQCNFTAVRGYIVSVVSANTEKGSYRKVLERSYADLKDSFCVYSPMLSEQDVIYWLFFSKDIFALDSVVKRIESYPGVRKADVFIPISTEYHKEVIIKEIERRIVEKREGSLGAKEISNVVA
ncbi:MAG TPA: winged helix-turn-helix transcriptional regulator [Nitrososphaeraceae archaeon]|nr:winged helix-turn-helix transcriptional regulator [Nitrososphaeraceae archaeon]